MTPGEYGCLPLPFGTTLNWGRTWGPQSSAPSPSLLRSWTLSCTFPVPGPVGPGYTPPPHSRRDPAPGRVRRTRHGAVARVLHDRAVVELAAGSSARYLTEAARYFNPAVVELAAGSSARYLTEAARYFNPAVVELAAGSSARYLTEAARYFNPAVVELAAGGREVHRAVFIERGLRQCLRRRRDRINPATGRERTPGGCRRECPARRPGRAGAPAG